MGSIPFSYPDAPKHKTEDSMSFLDSIPIIGKIFGDAADIAKEAITDKDKLNALLGKLEGGKQQIEQALYLKELSTKTIPWVDALHKMGRQLLNYSTLIVVTVLSLNNVEITPSLALILGGGNVAYQVIKGVGK